MVATRYQQTDEYGNDLVVADAPEVQLPSILDQFALSNELVRKTGLPIHLAMLETRTDLNRIQRLKMATSYTNVKAKSIGEYVGKIVTVTGAIVHWHGPYKSRPVGGESVDMPGFHHIILKTTFEQEVELVVNRSVRVIKQNALISTSATQPVELFLGMLQMERWYDWETGLKVAFTGTQSEGYFATVLDDDEEPDLPPAAEKGNHK